MLLLVSCQGPPERELESAQMQIDRARKAQADVYAPEMLREAEDLLSDASLKISEKSYSEARSLAGEAQKKAEQAEKSAAARISTERENGARFASATKDQLENLKSRAASLGPDRQGKQQSLALSLQELEGLLELFKSKLDSGKFSEARNIQTSLQQKLETVKATLESSAAIPEKRGKATPGDNNSLRAPGRTVPGTDSEKPAKPQPHL